MVSCDKQNAELWGSMNASLVFFYAATYCAELEFNGFFIYFFLFLLLVSDDHLSRYVALDCFRMFPRDVAHIVLERTEAEISEDR